MFNFISHKGNANTTMKYYHTPIRMAKIKFKKIEKTTKSWQGCREIAIRTLLVGM